MRIGIDATCWQNNRGYGRHARALLGALVKEDRHNRYTFLRDGEGGAPLPDGVELQIVRATAATVAQTGVEMEALTAASVAALTVYDMVKGVDRGAEIRNLRVVEKSGGRSGDWRQPAERDADRPRGGRPKGVRGPRRGA